MPLRNGSTVGGGVEQTLGSEANVPAMSEPTQSDGLAMAELMNPEVARHPQPIYELLRADAPIFRLDGVGVIVTLPGGGRRGAPRPRDVFSSSTHGARPQGQAAADPAADRSAGPPEVPQAPRPAVRAAADAGCSRTRPPRLVNDLIDGFVDERRDRLLRSSSRRRSPRRCSSPCSACRWTSSRASSKMKDGAIRPDQVVGHEFGHPETEAYQQQTADSIYAYFEQVHRRAAAASRATTCSATSCTPRSTAIASPTRRSSTSASCSSSPGSTR